MPDTIRAGFFKPANRFFYENVCFVYHSNINTCSLRLAKIPSTQKWIHFTSTSFFYFSFSISKDCFLSESIRHEGGHGFPPIRSGSSGFKILSWQRLLSRSSDSQPYLPAKRPSSTQVIKISLAPAITRTTASNFRIHTGEKCRLPKREPHHPPTATTASSRGLS